MREQLKASQGMTLQGFPFLPLPPSPLFFVGARREVFEDRYLDKVEWHGALTKPPGGSHFLSPPPPPPFTVNIILVYWSPSVSFQPPPSYSLDPPHPRRHPSLPPFATFRTCSTNHLISPGRALWLLPLTVRPQQATLAKSNTHAAATPTGM